MSTTIRHVGDGQVNRTRNITFQFNSATGPDSMKLWWQHALDVPLLNAAEERQMAQLIAEGDEWAYSKLVESNLRLVAKVAKKSRCFAGYLMTLDDLIQEGCLGLMRAARKYDYRRGFRFSTYATYWIRQAIFRAIAEQGRNIRLPVHMVESISLVERERKVLTQKLQRPPTVEELGMHLNISVKKMREIVNCVEDTSSLQTPVGEEGQYMLMDIIADDFCQSPADNAMETALYEQLYHSMEKLPWREAQVLQMHYGLGTYSKPMTYDQIGTVLDVTRERARQIEKTALARLQCQPELLDTMALPAKKRQIKPRKVTRAKAARQGQKKKRLRVAKS